MCVLPGDRRRLHVVTWEQKWGIAVPAGCVVHHLDWDKSHNDADNLVCLTTWEHEQVHNVIGGEKGREFGYSIAATRNSAGSAGIPPLK